MPRKTKAADPPPGDAEMTLSQLWDSQEPGSRVSKGIYSIYKTQDGGMHVSYRPEGTEDDMHLPIPAMLMQMMLAASEGKGPMGRLRNLAMSRMG